MNFKQKIKIILGSLVGYVIVKIFSYTYKLESLTEEQLENKIIHSKEPVIYAFWHNRQLMTPALFLKHEKVYRKKVNVLISAHADGRIIANIVKKIGLQSVAGSSTRGGSEALLQLIELVKSGEDVAITPDGPRGPIYKLKAGVIKLARETGAQVVPISMNASSYWEFGSWDKLRLPKPFSTIKYKYGEFITVKGEFVEAQEIVEEKLNKEMKIVDGIA